MFRWVVAWLCIWAASPSLVEPSDAEQDEFGDRRWPQRPQIPQRFRRDRDSTDEVTTTKLYTATGAETTTTWSVALRILARQLSVPITALCLGAVSCRCAQGKTAGAILIYFGAQTTMNLYVKEVLSKAVVSEELGMKGVPAPFLMTGLQQLVGFFMFCAFILISNFMMNGYRPQVLSTPKEYVAVCCFSFTFVLNIALNNFSISLLPLSVNLVIRSCLPLATYFSQLVLGRCVGGDRTNKSVLEVCLMFCGVICAGIVIWAQSKQKSGSTTKLSGEFFLGVCVAIGSLFSGALNMVLAGVLGTELHLSPLDAIGYMSIPATVLLILPSFFFYHNVSNWPDSSFQSPATDWEIFEQACSLKPGIAILVTILGPMAFAYNFLQVKLVHNLSATHVTFAGNFNKAASIALALILGMETLPEGFYGIINLLGCWETLLHSLLSVWLKKRASRRKY